MFGTIIKNFHIEKIIWILKTNIKYFILSGLIMGVIVGGITYVIRQDVYAAQISLYVYSNPDYVNDNGVNLSSADLTQASNLLSSYMQILKSNSFIESVIDAADLQEQYSVGMLREEISSSAVSGTSVFKVIVYDRNPYNAMLIANTIGELAPQKIISIVKSGGIEVLDEATLPTAPYESTSVTVMAILGVAVGVMLAMLLCVIKGLLDTRIRRLYEVEDLFNIPVVGIVPEIKGKNDKGENDVILTEESPFVLREAYNDIRTNMFFMGKGEKCPVFAITGADYSVGKTTSSINIARVLAFMDKKTLLIDADLRNGNVAEKLGLEARSGLSDFLANISELNIHKNVFENMDVLTTGTIPPNPTDLLISNTWIQLIENLKKNYDYIVLDTPSVGVVSDAMEVSNVATTFIIVVREFVSKLEREEYIVRRLESINADICGIIYNGMDEKSEDYNHKEYVNGGEYGKRSSAGI